MRSEVPQNIHAFRGERRLDIVWSDGHRSSYPFSGLRGVCPCVECRGGHGKMGQKVNPFSMEQEVFRPVELAGLERAGAYALKASWSDGHSTGLYTWRFLRDLCPCEACRAEHGAAGPG